MPSVFILSIVVIAFNRLEPFSEDNRSDLKQLAEIRASLSNDRDLYFSLLYFNYPKNILEASLDLESTLLEKRKKEEEKEAEKEIKAQLREEEKVANKMGNIISDLRVDLELVGEYLAKSQPYTIYYTGISKSRKTY